MYTDASKNGLGAYLEQADSERVFKVITMASRTLHGTEINYYTTKLELLSIVWALKKFRPCLCGAKRIIRTDHKALTFLYPNKFLSSRLLSFSKKRFKIRVY